MGGADEHEDATGGADADDTVAQKGVSGLPAAVPGRNPARGGRTCNGSK